MSTRCIALEACRPPPLERSTLSPTDLRSCASSTTPYSSLPGSFGSPPGRGPSSSSTSMVSARSVLSVYDGGEEDRDRGGGVGDDAAAAGERRGMADPAVAELATVSRADLDQNEHSSGSHGPSTAVKRLGGPSSGERQQGERADKMIEEAAIVQVEENVGVTAVTAAPAGALAPLPLPHNAFDDDALGVAELGESGGTPVKPPQRDATAPSESGGGGREGGGDDAYVAARLPRSPAQRRRTILLVDQLKELLFEVLAPFHLLAPLTLALTLLMFSKLPAPICNGPCECDAAESASFTFTYGIPLHLPRCLFFAMLTEVLVMRAQQPLARQRQQEQRGLFWDLPAAVELLRLRRVWALCVASFLSSLVMESQAYHLPQESRAPIAIAVFVVPFAVYCIAAGAARVSLPVAALLLHPGVFYLAIPQYRRTQRQDIELFSAWPLLVVLIDRVVFYVFFTVLPRGCGLGAKVVMAHVAAFPMQQLIVTVALATSFSEQPIACAIYFLLAIIIEFMCNTVLLDWFASAVRNKIADWYKSPAWRAEPLTPADFRSIATQTRHITLLLALVAILPVILIKHYPRKTEVTTCSGDVVVSFHWAQYAALWGLACFVVTLVSCVRGWHGRLRLPLYIRDGMWGLVCGLHLAMLAPETVALLPATFSGVDLL